MTHFVGNEVVFMQEDADKGRGREDGMRTKTREEEKKEKFVLLRRK